MPRVFLLIFVCCNMLYALVLGGSNLPIFGYADHDCIKPNKPYRPSAFYDEWEIESYNSKVSQYNYDLNEYIDCIEEYVDNAKNDIKRIQEKANDAVAEASY